MKIKQKQNFMPITITLETQGEVDTFLSVIDKCDGAFLHGRTPALLTSDEKRIVMDISNAFTDICGLRET